MPYNLDAKMLGSFLWLQIPNSACSHFHQVQKTFCCKLNCFGNELPLSVSLFCLTEIGICIIYFHATFLLIKCSLTLLLFPLEVISSELGNAICYNILVKACSFKKQVQMASPSAKFKPEVKRGTGNYP